MNKNMIGSMIRRCLWNQMLTEQIKPNSELDSLIERAKLNGLGQDFAPDGLKRNFRGSISYATEVFQDLAGNIWYHKPSSNGEDFWIMKDDLLTSIQGG